MLLAPIRKVLRVSGVELSQASPSTLPRSLCAQEGDAFRIERKTAAAATKSLRFTAPPFREPRASEGVPEIIGRKLGRRQGWWSQPVDQSQDLPEQVAGAGNLGHLERDVWSWSSRGFADS
jgi:hypothetical protein